VCEAVSVEKGARRTLLPAAVVCPPGGRRRRRLAITADSSLSVCLVYYCSTYYRERVLFIGTPFSNLYTAVDTKLFACVFITAVPITKLFAWGGGGQLV
jgi:hypothetical protein